jgi:hypothetical protein
MRTILTFLLLMVAAPACAEWVKVGKPGTSSFSFLSRESAYYIDPATIDKDGNMRKVWQIHDMKEKGSQGERSVLESVEYDCAAKRMRTLKATGKSQRMARGEIIPLRAVFGEWVALRPGRDDEKFLEILDAVCAL